MVDHVRTLLLNPPTGGGYAHVTDVPADAALALFGFSGAPTDQNLVDRLLPLALAPDLTWARDVFDPRLTPSPAGSVYRADYEASHPLDGLHTRVLGEEGWWQISTLFSYPDPAVQKRLSDLRDAARSLDSAYALGAVLLACAYRRHLLQGRD